jgi:hypothetical protein
MTFCLKKFYLLFQAYPLQAYFCITQRCTVQFIFNQHCKKQQKYLLKSNYSYQVKLKQHSKVLPKFYIFSYLKMLYCFSCLAFISPFVFGKIRTRVCSIPIIYLNMEYQRGKYHCTIDLMFD